MINKHSFKGALMIESEADKWEVTALSRNTLEFGQ